MAIVSLFVDTAELEDGESYLVHVDKEGKRNLLRFSDLQKTIMEITGLKATENQVKALVEKSNELTTDSIKRISNIEQKSEQARILDYVKAAVIVYEFTDSNAVEINHNRDIVCSVQVYRKELETFKNVTHLVEITHTKSASGDKQIKITSVEKFTGYATLL